MAEFDHYFKKLPNQTLDVYRVLLAFEVTDPCLQHAIKKLLVAGGRGAKGRDKDVAEALASLERFQDMRKEEAEYERERIAAASPIASGRYTGDGPPIGATAQRSGDVERAEVRTCRCPPGKPGDPLCGDCPSLRG